MLTISNGDEEQQIPDGGFWVDGALLIELIEAACENHMEKKTGVDWRLIRASRKDDLVIDLGIITVEIQGEA